LSQFQSPISIPNVLTIVRILLTPVFIILMLQHLYTHALLVFAAAGLSDGLDGFIARYFNQRTALGAILDPVADKMLLVSAYIVLVVMDVIPDWLAVIVIARDVIISLGIAIFTITEKKYDVHPSIISKCTTASQILLVLVSLFDPAQTQIAAVHPPLQWATAIITTISGLHYIYVGMAILQESNEKPQ
jgi:cardiolipin synthase